MFDMDKYVLLDFVDEETVDVAETAWLEIDEDEFEDMDALIGKTVVCNWQEKKRGQPTQMTRCSARVLCFGDDRKRLVNKREQYISTGTLNRTLETGKGSRVRKPNPRFVDSDDTDAEDEEEVAEETEKNKKRSVTKSANQLREILQSKSQDTALLAENLQLKEKIKTLEKLAERLTQTISCMDHLPKLLERMKQAPQAQAPQAQVSIEQQNDGSSTDE
ncbi:uncharacterized protein LOC117100451, partial [Anneissia japonica]|uniref:uncharacterized protein LOC117100451 n=1 Tax=Anneissia japonica TaxID=1529436 RepID=UPI0014258A31